MIEIFEDKMNLLSLMNFNHVRPKIHLWNLTAHNDFDRSRGLLGVSGFTGGKRSVIRVTAVHFVSVD